MSGQPMPAVNLLAEFNAPELLNLLADGAYITDTERRIVLWNAAAERITGWSSEDVVGRSCRDNLLVHIDKDGHQLCGQEQCPLHRSIVTNSSSPEPLVVFAQHKSGRRIPVEVMVAPVRNHSGEVIGGVELFRDVSVSMQDQLKAKQIQEMSVRCELPVDARVCVETLFEPRDLVGGDMYRVERLDGDTYAVVVADAMGHGVAAALHTMLLRSLWDDHRGELGSPAQFMRVVNQRLHGLMEGAGFFGTAVYVTYNAASAGLTCVRAGHPAPLLFRATGAVESVGVTNPALGMLPDTMYRESTVQLSPGDTLLLFTDGATEISSSGEKELDREGLVRLVREQIGQRTPPCFGLKDLQKALLEFSNQIHLGDDLTMVKLQCL